jgi:hypothetical protein
MKNKHATNEIIPPLAAIVQHFNTKDKAGTKHTCAVIAKSMFGSKASFVSSVNGRVLMKISFYSNPRSVLRFLKLFHAYAIKKIKKSNTPFLVGGSYHGCKELGVHARDSLYLKTNDDRTKYRKVEDFKDFALVSNKVYLSPRAMAAHLLRQTSNTESDIMLVENLKREVTGWKRSNTLPYINVRDNSSLGEGGEGLGGGGGNGANKNSLNSYSQNQWRILWQRSSPCMDHWKIRTGQRLVPRLQRV